MNHQGSARIPARHENHWAIQSLPAPISAFYARVGAARTLISLQFPAVMDLAVKQIAHQSHFTAAREPCEISGERGAFPIRNTENADLFLDKSSEIAQPPAITRKTGGGVAIHCAVCSVFLTAHLNMLTMETKFDIVHQPSRVRTSCDSCRSDAECEKFD